MSTTSRYKSDREFEADVRKAAEALLRLPAGECQARTYPKKGGSHVEIDGVAEDRGVVHLIMATTSTRLDKVQDDVKRMAHATEVEEARGNAVKRWMVVELPPEGPHGEVARRHGVTLLTFTQFRHRFFDAPEYLAKRAAAPFGSARDPATNLAAIHDNEYIEPPMENLEAQAPGSFADIIADLKAGRVVILLGPFGSGKSLTLREVWRELRRLHDKAGFEPAPVALNLREHWGAIHADEMLRRHSRSLGCARDDDLVVAWRLGLLAILVDGFDEVAAQGVATLDRGDLLRRVRFEALSAVRSLLSGTSSPVGAVIAGRDHYFDDRTEMVHALGLLGRTVVRYRIDEFDEPRTRQYLQRQGVDTPLPTWLPRRALLLGYLVHRGLLAQVVAIDGDAGQAAAWKEFLRLICEREAELDRAVMDPEAVQRVLEHLALLVRGTPSGAGPINASDLSGAYSQVTGQPPGDAVLMQLQRLPGLTERDQAAGSRSFVDEELLSALQGWAVARLLIAQQAGDSRQARFRVAQPNSRLWYNPLRPLAGNVARLVLEERGWTLDAVAQVSRGLGGGQLAADVVAVCISWAVSLGVDLDFKRIDLTSVHLATIDLDDVAIRGVRMSDSVVDEIVVGARAVDSSITLAACDVGKASGVGSRAALPSTVALDSRSEIHAFDALNTTASIVALPLDARERALLTVLKKLFRQRGAGRAAGAFHRGLPEAVGAHIDKVLALLIGEGMAWRLGDVFHPVWSTARRAHSLLDHPSSSDDPLLGRVRGL